MPKSSARVIIPDSHGNHIDKKAEKAFLTDLKKIDPDEIVMLGDHLDCGGLFNSHQRTYTNELQESYEDDCFAANEFLDNIQKAAPRAEIYYLEGNHEQHVERWAARTFTRRKDADAMLEVYGPAKKLDLKKRGIRYFKRSEQYMGISIQGTIKLGKSFYTHGISCSANAAQVHLNRFGANIVFGHTHRAQSVISRTVTSEGIGSWNFGTLAKLQPLYMHTNPTSWTLGYGIQFVAPSGKFITMSVPIFGDHTLLSDTIGSYGRSKR